MTANNDNSFVFERLKSVLETYNIDYNENQAAEELYNSFYVEKWDVTPLINTRDFNIFIVIKFEKFLDYLDFWTEEKECAFSKAMFKVVNYYFTDGKLYLELMANRTKTRY